MAGVGGGGGGWSEKVEDLVDDGDIDGAVSLLESVISELETSGGEPSGNLRLATAISDLADLHSSCGLSIKADDLRSRALLLRSSLVTQPPPSSSTRKLEAPEEKEAKREESRVLSPSSNLIGDEDDWEALADRAAPDEVLLSSQEPGLASEGTSGEEIKPSAPKRRGKGTFMFDKSCMYSEQQDAMSSLKDTSNSGDEWVSDEHHRGDAMDPRGESGYGTRHVLVLYDFSPTTRTIELEKLFDRFKDGGFAIRWVNDTTALAVFPTPSIAREAQSTVHCPFKVRTLGDEDSLLSEISMKDLEPPYIRPKTSARTAQRLIAHGMGLKPFSGVGSDEYKQQEESRKSRILARQNMRDEAWGAD